MQQFGWPVFGSIWDRGDAPRAPLPTGGTITTATIDGVEYRIHTFAEDGEFVCLAPLDVEYFMVGAGASGGSAAAEAALACGGAGGRVRHNLGTPARLPAGVYPVTVGIGRAPATIGAGAAGGDSAFFGVVAEGGLPGMGNQAGGDQGSNDGNVGGVGQGSGGAGDGSGGAAGPDGNGGDGSFHNPDGNPRHFGGGGGGRRNGIGGLGGGSDGTNGAGASSPPGEDGLGGGSGGSRGLTGKGGDGIVIIRYPV